MTGSWENLGFIGLRVTESQTPKGIQYMGGWNVFVPDFNKLSYSLRSQGDNPTKTRQCTLIDLYVLYQFCCKKVGEKEIWQQNSFLGSFGFLDNASMKASARVEKQDVKEANELTHCSAHVNIL